MSGSPSPIVQGYLILADISGYTSFISQTELDHAHEILSDLLETILHRFKPLLTIHKIEGDAIFAYTPETHIIRGETLLELVESTYVDFRDRMKSVRRHTTCTCRACQSIPMLDLKFILHHGDFILQSIGGTPELAGSDVNLVHRLLKNHVAETTGWRAYALFTAVALECMRLQPENLVEGTEAYEHLGEVKTHVMDLHARYDTLMQQRRVVVSAEEAHRVLEFDYAAAPPVLWEWFNEPAKRSLWMHSRILPVLRIGGRVAAGARNHCVHGKNEVVVEDVLDIKPFEYFTVEHRPQKSPVALRMTFEFIPAPNSGTRLRLSLQSRARGLPPWAARLMTNYIVDHTLRPGWSLEKIDALIEGATAPGA